MNTTIKKIAVGGISLIGGFLLMYALWALFTFKPLQMDFTDPLLLSVWVVFSLPVYAFIQKRQRIQQRRRRNNALYQ